MYVYMGDLSLWRVLLEVIFCFLSSSIRRSYSSNDVVHVYAYMYYKKPHKKIKGEREKENNATREGIDYNMSRHLDT